VDAGIDHQAAGAEQFGVELTETSFDVAFVPPGLRGRALGVQSPSFAERRDAAECANAAEPRFVGISISSAI
jgi:hypothetical protein